MKFMVETGHTSKSGKSFCVHNFRFIDLKTLDDLKCFIHKQNYNENITVFEDVDGRLKIRIEESYKNYLKRIK